MARETGDIGRLWKWLLRPWGLPLAYGAALLLVLSVIWGAIEWMGIPAVVESPPYAVRYRLAYHLTLGILVASHIILVLEGVVRRHLWASHRIRYRTHFESVGWSRGWASDGQVAGDIGRGKRLEGVVLKLGDRVHGGAKIESRAHVEGVGWQEWKPEGELIGSEGQRKRLEAIEVRLVNPGDGHSVVYRVYVADEGWTPWAADGAQAGTTGERKRLTAVQVFLAGPGGSNMGSGRNTTDLV